MLGCAAVAVVARVQRRQERRHRVRVRVVQLDAVEAGLARAHRRGGEQTGEDARQLADVRQVGVRRVQRARGGRRGQQHQQGQPGEGPYDPAGPAQRQHRRRGLAPPGSSAERATRAQRVGDLEVATEEAPGSGRRRTATKSRSWMKSRVRPRLRSRTVSTSVRSPGTKRSSPIRSRGRWRCRGCRSLPRGRRLALANRAYHSRTSGVTKPSAVARHGTIAGTQVRSALWSARSDRREP